MILSTEDIMMILYKMLQNEESRHSKIKQITRYNIRLNQQIIVKLFVNLKCCSYNLVYINGLSYCSFVINTVSD